MCFVCVGVCGWQICIVRNSVSLAAAGLKCDPNILKHLKIPMKGPLLGPLGAGTAQWPDDRITTAGNRSPRSSIITEYCGSHGRIFFPRALVCSALVCQRVVCVPDVLTAFVLRADNAEMAELEPCPPCQSDKELLRGAVGISHESAVEPHRGPVSRRCAQTSELAFWSGMFCRGVPGSR